MTEQRAMGVPQFELRHRLDRALEVASMKPEEMAETLGKSVTTIRNYLAARTTPDRGTLIAWALACGVPFDWLQYGIVTGPDDGDTLGIRHRGCYGVVLPFRGIRNAA